MGAEAFTAPEIFGIKNTVHAAVKRNEVLIRATVCVNVENHVQ